MHDREGTSEEGEMSRRDEACREQGRSPLALSGAGWSGGRLAGCRALPTLWVSEAKGFYSLSLNGSTSPTI